MIFFAFLLCANDANDVFAFCFANRDAIWSLLTGDCSIQNCDDSIKEDLKQIETFIMRLLSSPVPIAGRTKLEVSELRGFWEDKTNKKI